MYNHSILQSLCNQLIDQLLVHPVIFGYSALSYGFHTLQEFAHVGIFNDELPK